MALLKLTDLRKVYRSPDGEENVILDLESFALEEGEHVALAGASGSGKSTLLHLIAGILRPDGGEILFEGQDVSRLSESRRDRWRAERLGYVFQSFHLLPAYSALENVLLGMMFGPGPDRPRATQLLQRLGLGDRMHHRPPQLSIGQQQRVAVARALGPRPRLVLADEPTGSLDLHHAREALVLLRETCREQGAALLVVSHDPSVLADFERVVQLSDLQRAAGATA